MQKDNNLVRPKSMGYKRLWVKGGSTVILFTRYKLLCIILPLDGTLYL